MATGSLVRSYISKAALASDWESNLSTEAYILRLFMYVLEERLSTHRRKGGPGLFSESK